MLAAGALVAALAGCIPSLHPLYTPRDLAFEPALLGAWAPPDGKVTWAFSADAPDRYRLVYTDDRRRPGRFEVRLLKLKGHTFLDIYPEAPPGNWNDFYKGHLLRAHTFMQVRSLEPRLVIAGMNPSWLDKLLRADPRAIAHERRGEQIVLTAGTAELQAFVLKHLETPDAFGKPLELHRVRGGRD